MRKTFPLLVACLAGPPAVATTLPAGFGETLVAGAMASPTALAVAPDGRVFICQQAGQLRVVKGGVLLATPFVSLTVDSTQERGLLGVALDPGFEENGYVYVYHTPNTTPRRNRVTRFTASGDVAAAGSGTLIAEMDNLSSATNHNGGAMHFGTDRKLYVAVGDNANGSNSQTLNNRLGKILRYNPDGTIPEDNPFYATATGANRAIWALGLRNPYTFAIEPGTGRLFINDVGQNTWEEINVGIAGANYGWPSTEGTFNPASFPAFTNPLYAYSHSTGSPTGCAISGGVFYNPDFRQFPGSYEGRYFFADFCGAWIYSMDPASGAATAFGSALNPNIVDLALDRDGSLLYLSRGNGGRLYRIKYNAGAYGAADVASALRAGAGLEALPEGAAYRLDVERAETPGRVEIPDAVRIARLVLG